MTLRAGTPTDCGPLMISRTISGEEQQAGAPEGLILMPTTSVGSINLAHAARSEPWPVRSFIPCSIMRPHDGLRNAVPHNRFRIRQFHHSARKQSRHSQRECLTCGDPCTSIGGGSAALHSLVPGRWDRIRETSQRFPSNSPLRKCADPWLAPSKKADAQPTTPAILFTTFVSPS